MRVWRWLAGESVTAGLAKADEPPQLPDKPSIAVLPFDNMSEDPEQGYFADGITEDIITELSKFRWFLVIARNSTFTYKGKAVSLKDVGTELGARYVLEGSVRKSGNRVRINAQLIDALNGTHIWAEKYDRDIVDTFELQDEITREIQIAIVPGRALPGLGISVPSVGSEAGFRRCRALSAGTSAAGVRVGALTTPSQLELVQALAVVGERHQVPLAPHLVEAAQGEFGEAEHRLDDAEDRLDGLLTQPVEGAALGAFELGRHRLQPLGLGFLRRRFGLGRAEVVAPPAALRPGRHQGLDADLGKRRNLTAVSIAVGARATVGEMSRAMEEVFGRHKAEVRSVTGVCGAAYADDPEFQAIRAEVETFAETEGRRPRMLVVKLGQDGHDRGAKVIATAFADIGFDVDVGALFQTPEEAAREAIENDVHVIGVSTQAAGHKTLVPELVHELNGHGGGDVLVVCGGIIPPQDFDELRAASVGAIFGPGTQIPAAAEIIRLVKRERRAA